MSEYSAHPYSILGAERIEEGVLFFLEIMKKAGLPYAGSAEENMMMPTAVGTLVPATFLS